jgi:hypothetical protein
MHTVSPTITGTFMPTSHHLDVVESQMKTDTRTPDSPDSSCVSSNNSNEFFSCSFSDNTSETTTSSYASCDSSVQSDSPKPSPMSSCKSDDFFKVAADEVPSKTTSLEDLSFTS